jgi:hypothetical protein
MKPQYVLYKNPIQIDTLAVVQYLYYNGKDVLPSACIERNHPDWVTELPAIETYDGIRYVGIWECMRFYEHVTAVRGVLEKALVFKESNPEYRIKSH